MHVLLLQHLFWVLLALDDNVCTGLRPSIACPHLCCALHVTLWQHCLCFPKPCSPPGPCSPCFLCLAHFCKPCWLIPGLGLDFGTFHWLRETPSPVFPWSRVITILAFVFTLVSTISLRFCLPYQLWPWEPVSSTLCLCSPAWGLVHRRSSIHFLKWVSEWMNEWRMM